MRSGQAQSREPSNRQEGPVNSPPRLETKVESLVERDWPGNVRELRAAVERAVLLEELSDVGEPVLGGEDRPPAH